jgi:hypothetical protein
MDSETTTVDISRWLYLSLARVSATWPGATLIGLRCESRDGIVGKEPL